MPPGEREGTAHPVRGIESSRSFRFTRTQCQHAAARAYRTERTTDISEQELIEAITRVLSGFGDRVRVGPGDDAAVLVQPSGEIIVTTDTLVEGVHFDRSWMTARDIGFRSIAVNLSDVAAMAASPRWAVVALVLTPDVDAGWVMELLGGMREACEEHGVDLVGGDLSSGPAIVVTPTLIGEAAPGRALSRSGAAAGEAIVVTGELGAAAAGLRIARRGSPLSASDIKLIRAHVRPAARVGEAQILARHGATAMIDISDGLGLDLKRMADASHVGAKLLRGVVPVAEGATWSDAIGGGEELELLAALPADAVRPAALELDASFGVGLTRIGEFGGSGLVLIEPDGTERPLEPAGWDHFGDG
jgi:thiamine-monophosphate kinase